MPWWSTWATAAPRSRCVRAGRIAALRRVCVGGARLDVVTARLLARTMPPGPSVAVSLADARRVREALSLLPAVAPVPAAALRAPAVDAPARDGFPMDAPALDPSVLRDALVAPLSVLVDIVRAVLAVAGRDPPPVVLVGGVARTPLLAELLDVAGIGDVRVAERPDAAAVLGALRLPRNRLSAPLPSPPPRPRPAPASPPRRGDGCRRLRHRHAAGGGGSAPVAQSPRRQACSGRVPCCRRRPSRARPRPPSS